MATTSATDVSRATPSYLSVFFKYFAIIFLTVVGISVILVPYRLNLSPMDCPFRDRMCMAGIVSMVYLVLAFISMTRFVTLAVRYVLNASAITMMIIVKKMDMTLSGLSSAIMPASARNTDTVAIIDLLSLSFLDMSEFLPFWKR